MPGLGLVALTLGALGRAEGRDASGVRTAWVECLECPPHRTTSRTNRADLPEPARGPHRR